MSYSQFTLLDLYAQFGVDNKVVDLFAEWQLEPIPPSTSLSQYLAAGQELPARTEKARSELIVMPILIELRQITGKFFTVYSGETLNVDVEQGLTGECDFILAKDTGSRSLKAPFITLVEAKKQDLDLGIGQCAAQLLGAMRFNQRFDVSLDRLYGCVTTGDNWQFLAIENDVIYIDQQVYYRTELPIILGVFKRIIDHYRMVLT